MKVWILFYQNIFVVHIMSVLPFMHMNDKHISYETQNTVTISNNHIIYNTEQNASKWHPPRLEIKDEKLNLVEFEISFKITEELIL